MPSLNTIKNYIPDTYYHVYNRGVERRSIFLDHQDYLYFLKQLHKYLDANFKPSSNEKPRSSLASSIDLVAFCLMPNHFHILLYQKDDEKALEKLFRGLMTSYVMYFNQKYKRQGPLFQGRYKASQIDSDTYLYHISRYIHLNPLDVNKSYRDYPYSSYPAYQEPSQQSLIKTTHVTDLFDQDYQEFVDSYVELFKKRKDEDSFI